MAKVNTMVKGMDAVALYREGMKKAKNWLSNVANSKVNNDFIQLVASECGIPFEACKGLWAQVKEEKKRARKLEAFRRFTLAYKEHSFVQKVEYLTDKNVLIFKGLDRNGIYYAYEKGTALVFTAITASTEKSARNEWDKALVKANRSKVLALLNDASMGLSFNDLLSEMKTRSNYTERESKGREKAI